MTADNWRQCPRCIHIAEEEQDKLLKLVDESYGKVSANEYLQMVQETKRDISVDDTLREDYQLGMDEFGVFSVEYKCHCNACGYRYEYSIEIDVGV